ncbi:hypothetical protein, partial [Lacticaseibacillus paracasei]|uniref:hypothetical protein n=1 Tax=Lacticaseibacillus paracasei TaxID=1597 RepID=UPI001CDD13E3
PPLNPSPRNQLRLADKSLPKIDPEKRSATNKLDAKNPQLRPRIFDWPIGGWPISDFLLWRSKNEKVGLGKE